MRQPISGSSCFQGSIPDQQVDEQAGIQQQAENQVQARGRAVKRLKNLTARCGVSPPGMGQQAQRRGQGGQREQACRRQGGYPGKTPPGNEYEAGNKDER